MIGALCIAAYVAVIALGFWLAERYWGKTWGDVSRDLRAALARVQDGAA